MLEGPRDRVRAAFRRLRRLERRELGEFRRWIEHTSHLLHLTVLLAVPLLIGLVTALSNAVPVLSFLLFPPLAAGAYTLFADPEGSYASPQRFVAGLTVGALCGWVAVELSARLFTAPQGEFQVSAVAAAVSVFLTGAATWALNVEQPAAFAVALLVLLVDASPLAYVANVAAGSALVAAAFVVWRDEFYEQRARYLYRSTHADDRVLVPVRGDSVDDTIAFAATLASAHDAGKVVLLGLVEDDEDESTGLSERFERRAARVRRTYDVPCEVVVAGTGRPAAATLQAVRETNCDLVVTPYETADGGLSGYVRSLFRGDVDVVAVRTSRTRWRRVLVPVRRAGEGAHAKIDFACRLVGSDGYVGVATCIDGESERRSAERMLANLVEPFERVSETRVADTSIESFLAANAPQYDLVVIGASTDRSAASRFVSRPTFERIRDLDCDVAVAHRA